MEQETPTPRARRRSPSKRTRPSEDARTEKPSEGFVSKLIRVATGQDEERETETTDPIDMLTKDHDKVRALFKEFEDTGSNAKATRQRIVEQVSKELEIHAQIEEKIFYQAFRPVPEEKDSKTDPKKIVRESFEEHKIVKTLIAELAGMTPDDPQFEAKVTVLKENVEHHADEEEDDLFPAAKKLFDDEKLADLGRRMAAMKADLQKRA
jgi:hemerythrin superfamily protein